MPLASSSWSSVSSGPASPASSPGQPLCPGPASLAALPPAMGCRRGGSQPVLVFAELLVD
uniref:Uncharacterized protein n=1 Tax=Aotus nancymaae TaxID=37293 RepID=A0A2K5EDP1_AOTNA